MKTEFKTSSIAVQEQFDYWHDVVCQRFVSADSRNCTAIGFDAQLTSRGLGRLDVSEMRAPSHSWSRGRRHIRIDDEAYYLLSVIEEGTGVLCQNGHTAEQKAGDIALYDTACPFDYFLCGKLKLIKIPQKYLDARVPNAHELLARNLSRQTRLSALMSSMLNVGLEMDLSNSGHDAAGERLADSFVDLLLAMIDLHRDDQEWGTAVGDSLEKIRAYAQANLADGDLSPRQLAEAGAISTRTLNRLFARMGTTPMRWVLHERLRLAHCYLEEGVARSVTEAAFMVGFSGLGHFSRSFKQCFGHPPERLLGGRDEGG